jgi:hypothetical protein
MTTYANQNKVFQAFHNGEWKNIPQAKRGDRSNYDKAVSLNLPIRILWLNSGRSKIIKNEQFLKNPVPVANVKQRISVTADTGEAITKKKPGRPKGSVNKKKAATAETVPPTPENREAALLDILLKFFNISKKDAKALAA